jgi:hypothetical protein
LLGRMKPKPGGSGRSLDSKAPPAHLIEGEGLIPQVARTL